MVPGFIGWMLPKNMGLISSTKRFFPKNARGRIDVTSGSHDTTIIINGAITKLSEISGKLMSKLDFLYNKSMNKIVIKKKRRY